MVVKCIMKIIANRLKYLMSKLIGEKQNWTKGLDDGKARSGKGL